MTLIRSIAISYLWRVPSDAVDRPSAVEQGQSTFEDGIGWMIGGNWMDDWGGDLFMSPSSSPFFFFLFVCIFSKEGGLSGQVSSIQCITLHCMKAGIFKAHKPNCQKLEVCRCAKYGLTCNYCTTRFSSTFILLLLFIYLSQPFDLNI